MAHVELAIGGRTYSIACRDGGQEHLRALALRVDEKVAEARGAVGTTNESRQLLFAALLLADDVAAGIAERAAATPAAQVPSVEAPGDDRIATAALAEMLDALATRLERVADALDTEPAGAEPVDRALETEGALP